MAEYSTDETKLCLGLYFLTILLANVRICTNVRGLLVTMPVLGNLEIFRRTLRLYFTPRLIRN